MKRWKPSKAAKREYAVKMEQIATFCKDHGITQSRNGDSYYFVIDGINYRVSNHTVEKSNSAAYDEIYGKIRDEYHPNGRDSETVYIHAGKTRIIDIYNDLSAGYELDGRGNRK